MLVFIFFWIIDTMCILKMKGYNEWVLSWFTTPGFARLFFFSLRMFLQTFGWRWLVKLANLVRLAQLLSLLTNDMVCPYKSYTSQYVHNVEIPVWFNKMLQHWVVSFWRGGDCGALGFGGHTWQCLGAILGSTQEWPLMVLRDNMWCQKSEPGLQLPQPHMR